MKMNNGGTLGRTSDGIFDDLVSMYRNCRLPLTRPGAIQGDFQPNWVFHTYFLISN
jgi:hypothetical protein